MTRTVSATVGGRVTNLEIPHEQTPYSFPVTTATANLALARLDRLPKWPWSSRLLLNLGGSFFFAFYDIVVIGAGLPAITKQFGVTAQQGGYTITVGLLGMVIGEFLGAWLASRKSRVFALHTALWMFSLGMILSAVAPSLTVLLIARFIAGLGTGADIAVVVTYIAEISPSKMRGRITGFTTICGYSGIAVVPIVAAGLVANYAWGWRVMFALGAVGGIVVLVTRRHIPASPRMLAERGEDDQLEALVTQAENRVRDKVGDLPPVAVASDKPVVEARMRWGVLALFGITWILYYFGNYGWVVVGPTILTEAGFSLTNSLTYLSIANLGLVAGSVIAYFVSDRVERKWLLVGTFALWGVVLAAIAVTQSALSISALGFVASLTIGLGVPTFYTYTAEHFPSRFRPLSMSCTDGIGHLGGAIAPIVLISLGFGAAFGAMALSGLAVVVLLLFTGKTLGRSLEQIARGEPPRP